MKADSYHGIFPHFMNGVTGKTIAFGKLDDGADIVETSYFADGIFMCKENILMVIHRWRNIFETVLHNCGMLLTGTGTQTVETVCCTGTGAQ